MTAMAELSPQAMADAMQMAGGFTGAPMPTSYGIDSEDVVNGEHAFKLHFSSGEREMRATAPGARSTAPGRSSRSASTASPSHLRARLTHYSRLSLRVLAQRGEAILDTPLWQSLITRAKEPFDDYLLARISTERQRLPRPRYRDGLAMTNGT